MKILRSLTSVSDTPTAVALGCFDGLHLGHHAVIAEAKRNADALGVSLAVWTFASSPKNYFSPLSVPQLTDPSTKERLIEAMGAELFVCVPFDSAVAEMDARRFFDEVLLRGMQARHLVCGYNFSFGAGGRGNVALLRDLCHKAGIGLSVLPPVTLGDTPVSSSVIRALLEEGRPDDAAKFLGRPYSLCGVVLQGQRLGRRLGFPTINQRFGEGILAPRYGVYVTRVTIEGDAKSYLGITNVGVRPTVGSDFVGAETHIFELSEDLYGRRVTVEFLAFLRPERKFSSVDELSRQVHADMDSAKKWQTKFISANN